MNLTPDSSSPIVHELIRLYQRTHEDLFDLEAFQPETNDATPEAHAVRMAIAEHRHTLRALAVALAGRHALKVGQAVIPLGVPLLSLN